MEETKIIGKVTATEKEPSKMEEFYFWTKKEEIIKPFDVVKVKHIHNSKTFGVVEEISHITDASTPLAGYISSDFGDIHSTQNMWRIGMNYVKAKVVGNTENIYIPVFDGTLVSLATEDDIKKALGLDETENPLPCGYIEMYEGKDSVTIPVCFNSNFLIGPEGAHLNVSGISGLATKTSYAMFLIKAIQNKFETAPEEGESVAFVILNVKARDLLAIDEKNENIDEKDIKILDMLGLKPEPLKNVKYFYPYSKEITKTTYADATDVKSQMEREKAFQYKYLFDEDKENMDFLFANIDDPQETMDSIINYIISGQDEFANIQTWEALSEELEKRKKNKEQQ